MSVVNASLLRLKLLDALRQGDAAKVDAVVATLRETLPSLRSPEATRLLHTVLHYAVQVAPLPLISHLVDSSPDPLDINAQDPDGNTPLHLAAMALRQDVVTYLMQLPQINDTITNLKHQQAVEMCLDHQTIQQMQYLRGVFVEDAASKLRTYFTNRDFDALDALWLTPRVQALLDINGADPALENTVLHEYIRKDDLQMCDWILQHGGDPFKRDKRGKLPIDLVHPKNEPLRRLLKNASREQTIIDPVSLSAHATKSDPPTFKGYLKKWTNFASGWKLRYFVLDAQGVLSYYASQEDTNNACRGSLNLAYATVHLDSLEKLRFEVWGKNEMRWHLKANHPTETNRWVWTLQNAATLAKDLLKDRSSRDKNAPSSPQIPSSPSPGPSSGLGRRHRYLHLPRRSRNSRLSMDSDASQEEIPTDEAAFSGSHANGGSRQSSIYSKPGLPKMSNISEGEPAFSFQQPSPDLELRQSDGLFDYDMDNEDYDSDSHLVAALLVGDAEPPQRFNNEAAAIKRQLDVELLLVLDLFTLVKPTADPADSLSVVVVADAEFCQVAVSALRSIQDLVTQYQQLVQHRDEALVGRLARQLEVNKLWELSIRQLEDEIKRREDKLVEYEGKKKQLRKYLVGRSSHASPILEIPPSVSREGAPTSIVVDHAPDPDVIELFLHDALDDEFFDADEFEDDDDDHVVSIFDIEDEDGEKLEVDVEGTLHDGSNDDKHADVPVAADFEPAASTKLEAAPEKVDAKEVSAQSTTEPAAEKSKAQSNAKALTGESNVIVPPLESGAQKDVQEVLIDEGSYLGYEKPPRTALGLDKDNRPKVGLWGILKSMIGKDMTRMTLPVSFNEPTSLVQRLAEDVEYAELLNTAATYDDSTLRMVYVATFAASLYASSTGRVAKPFNPLLGETFEYSRPDQDYRLFVEQVSHHPPVLACSATSPKWDYYGENAVDSQFKGRSFDFKHLGKMFCIVRPDHGVTDKHGNQVTEEHYSWKKVNTSVVGIMLGNPTVDNYGKMEVTNHTTGDVAIVDMKQRGWRASLAYQLSGHVLDNHKKPQWAIGGHWDSKLFGKKLLGPQHEKEGMWGDHDAPASAKILRDPLSKGKFLVWQVTPRPEVPFNLTKFAVTLNGIDDNLRKWLAPTDTRLRPDQRLMEDGHYDEAAKEKNRVEEKQRAARKLREQSGERYMPNWFERAKHPITGDAYWKDNGQYWQMRRDQKLAGTGDIF